MFKHKVISTNNQQQWQTKTTFIIPKTGKFQETNFIHVKADAMLHTF